MTMKPSAALPLAAPLLGGAGADALGK